MSLQPESKIIQKVVENEAEIVKELRSLINNMSENAIKTRGCFNLGLSGGSMATFAIESLKTIQTDWSKWKMFLCDERLVPANHEDSTLRLYIEGLVGKTSLTPEQFIPVDVSLDVVAAASDYEKKIKAAFPDSDWPAFDLLLLGMGPDGHTASLFPKHSLLNESTLWIAPISDSPKPPPNRVTMTLPVINHARACIFAITGKGKASMLKRILVDNDYDLPSTRVKPRWGELFWIMDKDAASLL